jgi:hypothetical protein
VPTRSHDEQVGFVARGFVQEDRACIAGGVAQTQVVPVAWQRCEQLIEPLALAGIETRHEVVDVGVGGSELAQQLHARRIVGVHQIERMHLRPDDTQGKLDRRRRDS